MKDVAFARSTDTMTFSIEGKVYFFHRSDSKFEHVLAAYKSGNYERLLDSLQTAARIKRW